ncbi:hypothetical protein [Niallia sp.]|uniref:hypothetical protein n=1 Tax=Niallia sp. TaxID=2837523 RepID=UPI00289DCCD5|nr:hypothetical protein [Niallia sp.]
MVEFWLATHLSASFMNIIGWAILIGFMCLLYKRQIEKPVVWKMAIVVYIGLFCFNFQFTLGDSQLKIAILPLGVWILLFVFRKKKERWKIYRPFVWLGFFGNYIFLMTTLFIPPLQNLLYPTDKVETFLAELDDPSIVLIHPSGNQAVLNKEVFRKSLSSWELRTMDVQQWYQESFPDFINDDVGIDWEEEQEYEPHQTNEQFPYVLMGATSKWGSGYESAIYIETDGKGMIISTEKGQYYFRTSESILTRRTE